MRKLQPFIIGEKVIISGGARVIIDDPREPEQNVEVLDEAIRGTIKEMKFGRAVVEMPHNKVMVTVHFSSLRKAK